MIATKSRPSLKKIQTSIYLTSHQFKWHTYTTNTYYRLRMYSFIRLEMICACSHWVRLSQPAATCRCWVVIFPYYLICIGKLEQSNRNPGGCDDPVIGCSLSQSFWRPNSPCIAMRLQPLTPLCTVHGWRVGSYPPEYRSPTLSRWLLAPGGHAPLSAVNVNVSSRCASRDNHLVSSKQRNAIISKYWDIVAKR